MAIGATVGGIAGGLATEMALEKVIENGDPATSKRNHKKQKRKAGCL
jgi:hypothetical protein